MQINNNSACEKLNNNSNVCETNQNNNNFVRKINNNNKNKEAYNKMRNNNIVNNKLVDNSNLYEIIGQDKLNNNNNLLKNNQTNYKLSEDKLINNSGQTNNSRSFKQTESNNLSARLNIIRFISKKMSGKKYPLGDASNRISNKSKVRMCECILIFLLLL